MPSELRNSREEHAIETNSSNIAKVNTNASSEFYCDSHTGGSCRFWSCSSTRGPTMCKSSQCRCKPGFCAVNGICMERTAHVTDTCNRRTGGSCRFLGCSSWRGAVDCIDGACVCAKQAIVVLMMAVATSPSLGSKPRWSL